MHGRAARIAVPVGSFLASCMPDDEPTRKQTHLDCFEACLDRTVSLADFIRAFYATPLFKAERVVLKYAERCPSTDVELDALADAQRDTFAAWTVASRGEHEILLRDITGKTRSFLAVLNEADEDGGATATRLRFGTAVVATANKKTGALELGRGMRLFLPVHFVYSRALLNAAVRRLLRDDRGE